MSDERIRPSATVILWRRSPSLEVYLVERSQQTRFFPGYHAFPGGIIEAADLGDAQATPQAIAAAGPDVRRRAAARELQEETGVVASPGSFEPAGRLVTPPFGPTRYDTSFFLCEIPPGASPEVDGKELVSGRWWEPREALLRWRADALPIPPPTLAYLSLFATKGNPLTVAEAARDTDGKPHHERFRIEIHPGVYVLPLRAPTLPPATTQNCYLIDGDPILLIDPGSPHPEEHVALFHTLDAMLKEREREILVLLTHHHQDHIGAVNAVQERYGVRVLASTQTRDLLPEHFVDGVVAEGHVFDIGEWDGRPWRVEVMHTPGHAPGHLAFRDARWGAIFAGDLVSGVSTILVDPREGNMDDYMRSLERMSAFKPKLVLPGHGPALPRDAFQDTLAHRLMREERVLAALGESSRPIADLTPIVYSDTPPAAWGLAAANLESHLRRLEAKGKASRDDDGWRRVTRP